MTRRRLGLLLVFACRVAPLAAMQPSARGPRIGLRPRLASPCRLDAVARGRRGLSDIEGHHIVIERRGADGTVAPDGSLRGERRAQGASLRAGGRGRQDAEARAHAQRVVLPRDSEAQCGHVKGDTPCTLEDTGRWRSC
jgi:hypothetical protein